MKTRKYFKDFQRTPFLPFKNLIKRSIFCTVTSKFEVSHRGAVIQEKKSQLLKNLPQKHIPNKLKQNQGT